MKTFTDEDFQSRVKIGQNWMKKYVRLDNAACQRFRDPSATGTSLSFDVTDPDEDDSGGNVMEAIPAGQSNTLTANLLTKLAAVTIRNPDFHVVLKEIEEPPPGPDGQSQQQSVNQTDVQQGVRKQFRSLWKESNWTRAGQRAYLKRCLAGLGFVAYYWSQNDRKPKYEHVQSWNFAVDPCMNDWQNLKWAARRITLSLRDAIARYPDKIEDADKSQESGNLDKNKVKVWIYFDAEEEVHLLEKGYKVVKRDPNLYGKVPFLILEGDIDPGNTEFPLGDAVLAAGLQQEASDINLQISNKAKHGGGINWYVPSMLDKGGDNALKNGIQQGWIPIKDASDVPLGRIAGEAVTDAEIECKRENRQGIDEVTGVTPGMRGDVIPNVTATQSQITEQKSSARAVKSRSEYEEFMDRWAASLLFLLQKFGGPKADANGVPISDPREVAEWEALQYIEEVNVVESSTMYRDPSTDQQTSMTLLQQVLNSMETYINLAQIGLVKKVPKLEMYQNDALRAFGKQNVDEYWEDAPPPQPPALEEKPPNVSVNYKDVTDPEDRMAILQKAGLPGKSSEPAPEGGEGDGTAEAQAAVQGDQIKAQADLVKQERDHHHEAAMAEMKHGFDMELEKLKQTFDAQIEQVKLEHQSQLAEQQASTQIQMAETNNAAKEQQIKTQAASKPKPAAKSAK